MKNKYKIISRFYYLFLSRLYSILMQIEIKNAINGNRKLYDYFSSKSWFYARKYDEIRDNKLYKFLINES